jgi:hypothetical protein
MKQELTVDEQSRNEMIGLRGPFYIIKSIYLLSSYVVPIHITYKIK